MGGVDRRFERSQNPAVGNWCGGLDFSGGGGQQEVLSCDGTKMAARVPLQHYALRPSSFIDSSSLHDLNSVDSRPANLGNADPDDAVDPHSLDHHHDSNSVDCINESYRSSLHIQDVGVEDDRSSLDDGESSRVGYNLLTIDDVSPIEAARARFLEIIVDNFISNHVVEVGDSEVEYGTHLGQEKANKKKARDVQYEGDPRFALPLMYVANMYETLVNDVNLRLSSLHDIREKTIGVALEAAGGLYRRLAKKFPKKGCYTYKRRELATSLETRTRFPELVVQEEKRVRFVVVNGLDIVERPHNVHLEDAEWFKRLTGRSEFAVSAQDYKFYTPRHKYRRVGSASLPGLPSFRGPDSTASVAASPGYRSAGEIETPPKHHMAPLPHQHQFHPIHQDHHQSIHQNQHAAHYPQTHQCGPPTHLSEIVVHTHQSPTVSQHIPCLQTLASNHVGARMHVLVIISSKKPTHFSQFSC